VKFLQKYKRTFILAFQNEMEYRANFLLGIVSGGFVMVVQCFLWTAVFNSSPNSSVFGYTYSQMITYSIYSGIVAKLVSTGFQGEIANDIKNGGLSKFIAQPINYFSYRICNFFGGKILQTIIVLIILFVTMFISNTLWNMKVGVFSLVLFMLSVILGMVINFLIFYSVSSLAFIMTEVWGVFVAFGQGIFLLSGGIFPLDMFGEKVKSCLDLLPFGYIVYFPVNIINGHLNTSQIMDGMLRQGIWIILLVIISKISWKNGMRKYVAVGG